MGHADPRLRGLQRNVGYFYIVALGKRKQYAAGGRRGRALAHVLQPQRRASSSRGPGRLDRVRQEPRRPDERDLRQRAAQGRQADRRRRQPGRALCLAVQERGPRLLKKYKPSAARQGRRHCSGSPMKTPSTRPTRPSARRIGRKRSLCSRRPIRKADPARNLEKANFARYNLAFCYYKNNQFYEADVLAEHLRPPLPARRPLGQGDRDRHAVAGRRLQRPTPRSTAQRSRSA